MRRNSATSRIRLRPRAVPSRHARNRPSRRRPVRPQAVPWRRSIGGARKRHAAARRDGGDGADEGQMPDDVADAGFDLDDGVLAGHVDCRAKGCDMRVVMHAERNRRKCARTCSISRCRRTASRCGRRRRAMPPSFWWCGRARRPNSKIAPCAICRRCCGRGDASSSTTPRSFPPICTAAGSAAASTSRRSRRR